MKLPAPLSPFEIRGLRFVDSRLLDASGELETRRMLARGLFLLPPVLYCQGAWDPVREVEHLARVRGLGQAAAVAEWHKVNRRRETTDVWSGEIDPISFAILDPADALAGAFQLWAMLERPQSTERDTAVEARYLPAAPDLPIGEAMLVFLEAIFSLLGRALRREDGGTLTVDEWKAKHWWALSEGDWFFEPFEEGIRARVDADPDLHLVLLPEPAFPERKTWWIRRRGGSAAPGGPS